MAEWVTVARILRARGNRGEVAAEVLTNSVERLAQLREVTLFAGDRWPEGRTAVIEEVWPYRGVAIVKFQGVDSISDAELLRNVEVRIPFAERPAPPEGEYYHSDLIGCTIVDDASGEEMGVVEGVDEFGAAPLLKVSDGGGGYQVPLARAICVALDVAAKRIRVKLPEGLRDLNRG